MALLGTSRVEPARTTLAVLQTGASCVDGQCRLQSGECVAIKLGLDGQLDVGSLAEQVTPGLEAVVDYLAVVGSYAVDESGGISVGMVGGARSERNRCVPQTSQPEIEAPAYHVARWQYGRART